MIEKPTFKTLLGGHSAVFLGKRRVGTIVRLQRRGHTDAQWQYRPKGNVRQNGGDIYSTFRECAASLA